MCLIIFLPNYRIELKMCVLFKNRNILFTTLNEPALGQNTKKKTTTKKFIKFFSKQNFNSSQKYIQISIICVYFETFTEFSMYRKPSNNKETYL